MNRTRKIFQFRITLLEVFPHVWRRIQVPGEYTFWDLHVAIQDSMGWRDCHDHLFRLQDEDEIVKVGFPVDSKAVDEFEAGWDVMIDEFFCDPGTTTTYEYDSRDCWQHEVLLERVFGPEENVKYPRCICGRGACPPEDCGGPKGYLELRQILRDPKDKEYQQKVKWMSGMVKMRGKMPFDEINPGAVRFSKPRTRLKHKMKDLPSPKDDRPHPVRSSWSGPSGRWPPD